MSTDVTKNITSPTPMSFKDVSELLKSWDILTRDLVGKSIIIRDYEHIEAYDKPALLATVEIEGQEKKLLINSSVLMKELVKVQSYLPMTTTIKKHKNYFIFT